MPPLGRGGGIPRAPGPGADHVLLASNNVWDGVWAVGATDALFDTESKGKGRGAMYRKALGHRTDPRSGPKPVSWVWPMELWHWFIRSLLGTGLFADGKQTEGTEGTESHPGPSAESIRYLGLKDYRFIHYFGGHRDKSARRLRGGAFEGEGQVGGRGGAPPSPFD